MQNKRCYKNVEGKDDSMSAIIQLGVTDEAKEGMFVDFYTEENIEYLPWAQDRPMKATKYNCVRVTVEGKERGEKYGQKQLAEIWDGPCQIEECAMCNLPTHVARMKVRGLCKIGSVFDKVYYYTILENGTQAYMGRHNSLILYNTVNKYWEWRDSRDADSIGNN